MMARLGMSRPRRWCEPSQSRLAWKPRASGGLGVVAVAGVRDVQVTAGGERPRLEGPSPPAFDRLCEKRSYLRVLEKEIERLLL